MTFGIRNTSKISALTLPPLSAKMVTVESMLKGMGGETHQTPCEWFLHNHGLYWPMLLEQLSHHQLPRTGSQGPVA